MASLDLCRAWHARERKRIFAQLEKTVSNLKQLAYEKGICQPVGPCDPVRLTLNTASVGYEGRRRLPSGCRDRGIEPEYADGGHVVLILTP